jgi:hypothetical protein
MACRKCYRRSFRLCDALFVKPVEGSVFRMVGEGRGQARCESGIVVTESQCSRHARCPLERPSITPEGYGPQRVVSKTH